MNNQSSEILVKDNGVEKNKCMKKMYVSNSEQSTRLFKSEFLETFSKVHYSVPLIIFIPVILYFVTIEFRSLSIVSMICLFILGLLIWSLVEYLFHRFVFHYRPSTNLGSRLHFIFHGIHHDFPRDRMRLVLPPVMSIPLSIFFYFLFRSLTDSPLFYPFFGGFIFGYLCYDIVHYAIHHSKFKGKFWNALVTNHLKHHYVDDTKGFGVSSTIWDQFAKSDFSNRSQTK